MDPASQPDSPSEWSKFAPLPPRTRGHSLSLPTENPAYDTPCSETAENNPTAVPEPIEPASFEGENLTAARGPVESTPITSDLFVCQNRKCQERRERRALTAQPLFAAHWRALKIGKRHVLVLDLAVRCPDCEMEHVYTLVPPEWLEVEG